MCHSCLCGSAGYRRTDVTTAPRTRVQTLYAHKCNLKECEQTCRYSSAYVEGTIRTHDTVAYVSTHCKSRPEGLSGLSMIENDRHTGGYYLVCYVTKSRHAKVFMQHHGALVASLSRQLSPGCRSHRHAQLSPVPFMLGHALCWP